MARPKKEINWDLVIKKMEAGCSAAEIYSSNDDTGCDMGTFYNRFREEFGCSFSSYSQTLREFGKGQIRSMLHLKSLDNRAPGNTTLLMFLARCELGMKENLDITPNNDKQISNVLDVIKSFDIDAMKKKIEELSKENEELKREINVDTN